MNRWIYKPVMPVLPGDMEGISHISPQAHKHTQPLFLIVEPRPRVQDGKGSYVNRAADLIIKAWRYKHNPLVELYDVPTRESEDWWSSDHPLLLLHKYLRVNGVHPIPVTATDRKGAYQDALVKVARDANAGIAVHLYADDLEIPSATLNWISAVGRETRCSNQRMDIIIDMKRIRLGQMETFRQMVVKFLAALNDEDRFRSVTLTGSSLPDEMSGKVPENEERDFPRLELRLWRDIRATNAYRLSLGLGDYGVVRPEYDDRKLGFSHINGKILYTTGSSIRVIRGRSRKKERLEHQYPRLASRLVSSTVFGGSGFSWGDARIAACAKGVQIIGQPKDWVAICTSHHIELVPTQVARELPVSA